MHVGRKYIEGIFEEDYLKNGFLDGVILGLSLK